MALDPASVVATSSSCSRTPASMATTSSSWPYTLASVAATSSSWRCTSSSPSSYRHKIEICKTHLYISECKVRAITQTFTSVLLCRAVVVSRNSGLACLSNTSCFQIHSSFQAHSITINKFIFSSISSP
jgi:hypothetical protein